MLILKSIQKTQRMSMRKIILPPGFLNHPGMKKGSPYRQAGLHLSLSRLPKKYGLGEPFGKASLSKAGSGSSGSVPMAGRDFRAWERGFPLSSKAWPDEGLGFA